MGVQNFKLFLQRSNRADKRIKKVVEFRVARGPHMPYTSPDYWEFRLTIVVVLGPLAHHYRGEGATKIKIKYNVDRPPKEYKKD